MIITMKRCKIPAFGNWDSFEGLPITKYFDSAIQAGLIHSSYIKGHVNRDLFEVPVKPNLYNMTKGGGDVNEKKRKQIRVFDAKIEKSSPKNKENKIPKAVDEDLYKIPPGFLYQKNKMKSLLMNFCTGCMCTSISSVV
ncbi:hypothetical protein LUZ60_004746 [Juncus effusus]|nr:hypothetical protein LUZ60_004746 [Juncus effusus]